MNITSYLRHLTCIASLLLLCFISAKGQELTMHHLGADEGLENTYVVSFAQDRNGCVWAGTEAGLFMFDGKRFTSFTIQNSDIVGDGINSLYYEPQTNMLWVGSKLGVCRVNCATKVFETIRLDSIYNVNDLKPDKDGKLWIVNVHSAIARIDPVGYGKGSASNKAEYYRSGRTDGLNGSFRCAVDKGDGKLYIGQDDRGLSVLDTRTRKVRNYSMRKGALPGMPNDHVNCIATDRDGRIWIGTEGGLVLFDEKRETFGCVTSKLGEGHSLLGDNVYAIQQMRDGSLWVATTDGGVSAIDLSGLSAGTDIGNGKLAEKLSISHIRTTFNCKGPSSDNTKALFEDYFGNKWIGNYGAGIDVISHRQAPFRFLPYVSRKDNAIRRQGVTALAAGTGGELWAGAENEVAMCFGDTLRRVADFSKWSRKSRATPQFIYPEENGDLLVCVVGEGLYKYHINGGRTEHIDFGEKDATVSHIWREKDGSYLLSTNNGLRKIAPDYSKSLIAGKDNLLPGRIVTGALRDRQGKLWVVTYGSGIKVFDKNGNVTVTLTPKTHTEQISGAMNCIFMDTKGGIWVGSRECLTYVPDTKYPERIKVYDTTCGMADSYVKALTEDEKGDIWMSTNKGITKFCVKEGKFVNYDSSDGLPEGCFREKAVAKLPGGAIVFGSDYGASIVNPQAVDDGSPLPPVRILGFSLLRKDKDGVETETQIPTDSGEMPVFSHSENTFRIVFSVCDCALSRKVEYAYFIEGESRDWISLGSDNTLTLSDMSAGKHTVRIRARLKNCEWGETQETVIHFTIRTPFWLSWYAYTLYIIIVASLALWTVMRRKRQKTAQVTAQSVGMEAIEAAELQSGTTSPASENENEGEAKEAALLPEDAEFMEKLRTYIDENIDDLALSIEDIAKHLCMSPSTLHRKIKAITGMSPKKFVCKQRLKLSRELLATGKYMVSEVAERCGFSSTSYFSACFKREYGTTPSEATF